MPHNRPVRRVQPIGRVHAWIECGGKAPTRCNNLIPKRTKPDCCYQQSGPVFVNAQSAAQAASSENVALLNYHNYVTAPVASFHRDSLDFGVSSSTLAPLLVRCTRRSLNLVLYHSEKWSRPGCTR